LKEVLRAPKMRREFLKGASDDDDAVVDAFTHHNRESALKTKPKVRGFLCFLPPSILVESEVHRQTQPSPLFCDCSSIVSPLFMDWDAEGQECQVRLRSRVHRPTGAQRKGIYFVSPTSRIVRS
jgi:hypothetical protein